jgi:hypothetical protein
VSGAEGRGPVLVGVTGHRVLEDAAGVAAGVGEALRRVGSEFPGRPLALLSSLAEGADRVAARAVLARAGATLVAVLPLAPADYARDFRTEASRREFFELLARAEEIVGPPSSASSREEAYEAAGAYVVERCEVLLAVWDGRPARGRGGTAQIVGLARARGRPLAWVHAGDSRGGDAPDGPRADDGAAARAAGSVTFENF